MTSSVYDKLRTPNLCIAKGALIVRWPEEMCLTCLNKCLFQKIGVTFLISDKYITHSLQEQSCTLGNIGKQAKLTLRINWDD